MKVIALGPLVAALAFAGACRDAPTLTTPAFDEAAGTQRVTVMTQNLYVGADVDAVIAALGTGDPTTIQEALGTAIATLHETDFAARAGAFAAAIDRHRPDVVGFQEVSDIHIHGLESLGIPAIDLTFMPIILDSLAARGLRYAVAEQVQNIDAVLQGGAIELVDYDAILVNTDRVTVLSHFGKTFNRNLADIIPPEYLGGVALRRGFVEVEAEINGQRYWFVSTHPEPDLNAQTPLGDLRQAQVAEIADSLSGKAPAFVMGDLNDDPGSPMYQVLQGAGFADVWGTLRPGTNGYTDSHPLDLSEQVSHLTRRIDYVWARGLDGPSGKVQGRVTRINILPWERVQGPDYKIWSSDHAGLVATLQVSPAAGVTP